MEHEHSWAIWVPHPEDPYNGHWECRWCHNIKEHEWKVKNKIVVKNPSFIEEGECND